MTDEPRLVIASVEPLSNEAITALAALLIDCGLNEDRDASPKDPGPTSEQFLESFPKEQQETTTDVV